MEYFKEDFLDVRRVEEFYLSVKCLQCFKMFCTALLLPTCNQDILVITINTAHLEEGALLQKPISFPPSPPTSVTKSQQLCAEVGAVLCIVFGIIESECSGQKKRKRKPQAFFIHHSTCMSRQLSLPMNVAVALQKKGFSFLNWTLLFFFVRFVLD